MEPLALVLLLAALLIIAIGAGWGAVLARRFRLSWGLWGIGAATFFLSQAVHLPLLTVVNRLAYHNAPPAGWQPSPAAFAIYAAVLGLLAGLCEEVARYLVLRYWAVDARSWRQALMFGAGHGGLEAILIGGWMLVNFFSLLALRGGVPADKLAQVQSFLETPWWMLFLGVWERFWTLPIHVFLAVLVMRAFTHRNAAWLGAAILWHTLVDAAAVAGVRTWGLPPTEGLVALLGALSLSGIFLLRETEPPLREPASLQAQPFERESVPLPPPEATPESLEATRYES